MFEQIFLWLALQILSLFLTPKPKVNNAVAATEISATLPSNEVGKEIPILFGTKVIKNPLVSWYGNLNSVPIRKKGGGKK